jgi:hypothetical protein
MRSASSVLAVSAKRSAKQFACGHPGGIVTVSIPGPARTASKAVVNWAAAVADEEPEGGGVAVEVHQDVAVCWVVPARIGWLVVNAGKTGATW